MSSDEENRFNNEADILEYNSGNEETITIEDSDNFDDLSLQIDVKFDGQDSQEIERNLSSHDHDGKISSEELPHSGNTGSFKTKFEEEPSEEERRTERRRERRRRRRLTEEENEQPNEGTAKSAVSKFEHGDIDDRHFHKTDTSHDAMAESGTVIATTEKFRAGKYHSESDEENKRGKNDDVSEVVESGTAASRRKALEEHVEEVKKGITNSPKVLEEDAPVLKRGRAADTRAKLERISSEERILEKEVDVNTPTSGTASARRARFEEKARQASVEEVPKQKPRTARRSKWPEPNTNYRQRRGELRKSTSTDDEGVRVEKENANNIERNEHREENCSTDNTSKSNEEQEATPVKTSEIRNKLVKMLSSEDERSPSPPVDLGPARPTAGTARNLRARFEASKQTNEECYKSKSNVRAGPRVGYASRVRDKFESGEVSRRRSSVDEEDGSGAIVDAETRRRRTSSTRSIEAETSMMSRSAKELRSRFENPSQNTQHVKRNFVLRPKATTASITSKFNKTSPVMNKCSSCAKTVYPMEMITADDRSFHKKCFKCTECKATLRLGNYAALQGQIYCKPHFKQLFKVKGNYDEGFGRQQHKKNWEEKAKNHSESEENKPAEIEVDSNANVKTETDSQRENGFDHPPQENGFDHPPDEQTNGYDSAHDDNTFIEDEVAT